MPQIQQFGAFYDSTRAPFGGCGNLAAESPAPHTRKKTLCILAFEKKTASFLFQAYNQWKYMVLIIPAYLLSLFQIKLHVWN